MSRRGPMPGMDPWLQSLWGTFHTKLCTYLSDRLNEDLAPGLVAVAQHRVLVESSVAADRSAYPDVHILERRPAVSHSHTGPTAAAEPILVEMPADSFEQPYVEIRDVGSGGTVVTTIEVVSPSNKRSGEGRDLYVQKQDEVRNSTASLVELDLIRGFRGVTLAWKYSVAFALDASYHAVVRRGTRRRGLEVYPIAFRDPLPTIRIPLREHEADVPLQLQAVLDETYRRGRFAELIDYDRVPDPPIDPEDAAWAAERIAAWRAGPA